MFDAFDSFAISKYGVIVLENEPNFVGEIVVDTFDSLIFSEHF